MILKMRSIFFLITFWISFLCYAEDAPPSQTSIDFSGFIEKIEELYHLKGDGPFIYKILLNKGMKNQEKISLVCKSMMTTLHPEEIVPRDTFIWRCSRAELKNWLGNLDEYAYVEPLVHFTVRPTFPSNSVFENGEVTLEFDVDAYGNRTNTRVLNSTHERFSAAALEAFQDTIIVPATKYGERVGADNVTYTMTYEITH